MKFLGRLPCAITLGLVLLVVAACQSTGPLTPTGQPATPPPTPTPGATPPPGETPAGSIVVTFQDGQGAAVDRTVDGNALQMSARLPGAVAASETIEFRLEPLANVVADCTIPQGAEMCSVMVRADGWAWQDRQLVGERTVQAVQVSDTAQMGRAALRVDPKPVILVHGLNSDAMAWSVWTAPGGYLEQHGLRGFAVDDGFADTPLMHIGAPTRPREPTNTIAQNADILARYVEAVRAHTGAERVDVIGHSMGGLISRYYIQNLMPVSEVAGLAAQPVVNQLYMLGTPNLGTACARVPAALGLFSPAAAQVTPEYITQVFNPTVHDARGVPVFAIAGDAVRDFFAIRCTGQPTDLYVSVDSVLRGVSVIPATLPLRHGELPQRQEVFELVLSSLARSPRDYPIVTPEPTAPIVVADDLLQSTVVQGGVLQTGVTATVTVTLDQARSASFILYAPGSVVSMTIRTVSGAILTQETPQTNPNVSFDLVSDGAVPLTLGYGVLNPRAGAWELYLTPHQTPEGGGPFAVMATLDSDLALHTEVQPGSVPAGGAVVLRATLASPTPPTSAEVRATVRDAAGTTVAELTLLDDGQQQDGAANDGTFAGNWQAGQAGDYTVIVVATGVDGSGNLFDRLAITGVEVSAP